MMRRREADFRRGLEAELFLLAARALGAGPGALADENLSTASETVMWDAVGQAYADLATVEAVLEKEDGERFETLVTTLRGIRERVMLARDLWETMQCNYEADGRPAGTASESEAEE